MTMKNSRVCHLKTLPNVTSMTCRKIRRSKHGGRFRVIREEEENGRGRGNMRRRRRLKIKTAIGRAKIKISDFLI